MAEALFFVFFFEGGRRGRWTCCCFFGKTLEVDVWNSERKPGSTKQIVCGFEIFTAHLLEDNCFSPTSASWSKFFFGKFWRQRCAEERGIHAQALRCQRCIRPGPGWTWHRDGKWWGTWCEGDLTSSRSHLWEHLWSWIPRYWLPPVKMKECLQKRDHFQKEISSSNQEFSGDMLVFRGYLVFFVVGCLPPRSKCVLDAFSNQHAYSAAISRSRFFPRLNAKQAIHRWCLPMPGFQSKVHPSSLT